MTFQLCTDRDISTLLQQMLLAQYSMTDHVRCWCERTRRHFSDVGLSDQAASESNGNYFTQSLSGTGSRSGQLIVPV
jgi:hypothetical protein